MPNRLRRGHNTLHRMVSALAEELTRWAGVVKSAGIKLD